jgi:GT2 family glycosyltransferase
LPRKLSPFLPAGANIPADQAMADATLRREQGRAPCSPGPCFDTFVPREKADKKMTAIVCSKTPDLLRACLESLGATAHGMLRKIVVVAHEETGPNPALRAEIARAGATIVPFSGSFNFAAMNNLGARLADTPNLLFLNDDIKATAPGWAEMLAEQVSRPEVGITGAILWYPSGVLQHAGVVAGIGDGVGHVGRHMHSSDLWPWLLVTRNVSAVTGACLAIRKELFGQLGGFDTQFPNNYNDVDLCFRVRRLGYRVICVSVSGLIHAECQSRPGIVRFEERYAFYRRWADILGRPDPYYSIALSPTENIALNLTGDSWYRPLLAPENPGQS